MTGRSVGAIVVCLFLLASALGSRRAVADDAPTGETLTKYLTPEILKLIFPGADKIGEVDGTPPSAAVYSAEHKIGYLFSTWDVTQSKGFSNQPLILLVGLDLEGHIAGARVVHHTEPIAILGLHDEDFHRFTETYKGLDIRSGVDVVIRLSSSVLGRGSFSQRAAPGTSDAPKVDAVSRATTSSVLMSDAIVRGARIVARTRGILPPVGTRAGRLDVDKFAPADWPALEAEGAIAHLQIHRRDLADPAAGASPGPAADAVLGDVYVALLTPAGIGVNILGKTWYGQYTAGRGIDDQILLIAANGNYSVLGDSWEQRDYLDRVEIAQDEKTIHVAAKQVKTLPFLHAEAAPDLAERALVFFSGAGELDPTRPFEVSLIVPGSGNDGHAPVAALRIPYKTPSDYMLPAAETGDQGRANTAAAGQARAGGEARFDWREVWRGRELQIVVLGIALGALTVILFLQDVIARRPRVHRAVRISFLGWTLVWLGWYAGAQLTVVGLITDIHAAATDFQWDFLLVDPLIAILSLFTLAALFLWGRAAFCGWLCPFGALQELANMAARKIRIPQIAVPMALHERLVAVKYLFFLGLVATSFVSWDMAMTGAEVEPFKAAIILRFMTEWPMAAYALALVAVSLVVERFYCRFLCPLGGGLSILGRVRMFNWLKRHPQCGTECRICEAVCPVGAIKRSGEIDMNECFYCLDCQVTYFDDHRCPPMIARRKRRAERPKPLGIVAERRLIATSGGDGP
jgi:NosR/NirI family transcriptional regulator, nitrous oxide reductase regulator